MDRYSTNLNAVVSKEPVRIWGVSRRLFVGAGALLAAAIAAHPAPAQAVSVFELPQKLEGLAKELEAEFDLSLIHI